MTIQKPLNKPRTKRTNNKRKGKMINGHSPQDAIKAVQNWAMKEDNEDFDTSFVDSISEKLEEFGQLTERQESALENIIGRFEIDIPSNM